jgi:25S rRNA (adenine2142-N1)-methyltransferase
MGSHRTTIKRKKPLTHIHTKPVKRRDAIKALHNDLKSSTKPSIPLSTYQTASLKGQDVLHGGDSSKVLVQWLNPISHENLQVLEIGCLEVDNAIGKYISSQNGMIRRIDLKSRDPRIEEQDFMSLPTTEVFLLKSG